MENISDYISMRLIDLFCGSGGFNYEFYGMVNERRFYRF